MPRHRPSGIFDDADELVALVLFDATHRLPAADLLVQSVEELLTRGRTCVGSAVLEGSSEATE